MTYRARTFARAAMNFGHASTTIAMKSLLATLIFTLALAIAGPAVAETGIDINHADAKTLAEGLSDIGLVKAEAIVRYRNEHGPFRSVDELGRVKGIGPITLQKNRSLILIVPDAASAPRAHGQPTAAQRDAPPRPGRSLSA